MPNDGDQTGLDLQTGSIEEARDRIGTTGPVQYAPDDFTETLITEFASLVEDGNPLYWDERYADRVAGGRRAPPGVLMITQMHHLWNPGNRDTAADVPYRHRIPFPEEFTAIIATKAETTFERPLYEGDRLHYFESIDAISDEKETALGRGHFMTSTTTFNDETGATVAENTLTLLRHAPADNSSAVDDVPPVEGRRESDMPDGTSTGTGNRYESRSPEAINVGDEVGPIEFPISYKKVIEDAAATRDYYPGHHDPAFARNQGNESIYFNTMGLQGLVDRLVTEWSGPVWTITERTIAIQGSAVAGNVVTAAGEVTDVRETDDGVGVDVECGLTCAGRDILPSSVTIHREAPEPSGPGR